MLTYFPSALPDELLYSRLARYHLHTCSTSPKQTLDDLFGDRSVRASIDLQCHLGALSARMPAKARQTPHQLACSTLLGYYSSYQPSAIVKQTEKAMIDGPAAGLHVRLGIAAGLRIPSYPLRWCPRCYAEAIKLHGEAYWRRVHQLPGVLLCPSHSEPLQNAALPEMRGQHAFIAASPQTCPRDTATLPDWVNNKPLTQLLSEIARKSARLLAHPIIFPDFDAAMHYCRRRLISAGLAQSSGRLRVPQLMQTAQSKLAPLHKVFSQTRSVDWLIAMGRKHRHAFSPLQHFLWGCPR